MLDMASAKTCMTEHGMRMTPQRREILGFLCGNTEHPRIEDLTAHVRRTLPDISVSTIYKNVHELASIGLIQELGREPTLQEISQRLGMPEDKIAEVIKIAQDPVSLETPVGEEDDSHLGDFIQDNDAMEPAESASFNMLRQQLNEVMETLSPRECKVIRLRFGLEDGRAHTLEEVGKEFDVTRERVRQIEAKALRKLRHPSRSKILKDFLN